MTVLQVRKIDQEQMCDLVSLFLKIYSDCVLYNKNCFFSVLGKLG